MDTAQERMCIMVAYEALPTDQLVADIVIYTHDGERSLHWTAAAVLDYSRGGLYLDTARTLITQILEDASEISWREGAYEVIRAGVKHERVRTGDWPHASGDR